MTRSEPASGDPVITGCPATAAYALRVLEEYCSEFILSLSYRSRFSDLAQFWTGRVTRASADIIEAL